MTLDVNSTSVGAPLPDGSRFDVTTSHRQPLDVALHRQPGPLVCTRLQLSIETFRSARLLPMILMPSPGDWNTLTLRTVTPSQSCPSTMAWVWTCALASVRNETWTDRSRIVRLWQSAASSTKVS